MQVHVHRKYLHTDHTYTRVSLSQSLSQSLLLCLAGIQPANIHTHTLCDTRVECIIVEHTKQTYCNLKNKWEFLQWTSSSKLVQISC